MTPLDGYSPVACVCKFLGAWFFGCLVDVVIIAVLWPDAFESSMIVALLVAIPIVWGILGIFFFDRMLELGRKAFEFYFHPDR